MAQLTVSINKLAISFSILTALLSGCGSETETPVPTETATGTPTLNATPSPSAPDPLDDWQMMTSLQIADQGQGMDLAGDPKVDNNIHDAMEAIQNGIMGAIEDYNDSQTDFPGQIDECEESPTGCDGGFHQQTMERIEAILDALISVEALNTALALPFNAGQHPYAFNISNGSTGHDLYYWTGRSTPGGYELDTLIGTQGGTVWQDGRVSRAGPGTYDFRVELVPPAGEPLTFQASLYQAHSQFVYDADGLDGAFTGGGVSIGALLELSEAVLELIFGGVVTVIEDPDAVDIDAILGQLEDSLEDVADIPCGNGDQCISMSLIYDTVPTSPAP